MMVTMVMVMVINVSVVFSYDRHHLYNHFVSSYVQLSKIPSSWIDLLDDLFERLSSLDEPIEMNYIRKHVLEFQQQGNN